MGRWGEGRRNGLVGKGVFYTVCKGRRLSERSWVGDFSVSEYCGGDVCVCRCRRSGVVVKAIGYTVCKRSW
jgi:hypothetical protein